MHTDFKSIGWKKNNTNCVYEIFLAAYSQLNCISNEWRHADDYYDVKGIGVWRQI